ncbi:hypothetical protein [Streptacidiphilus sp. MAP5-3]|uniref:hypothetical protein n=1 Tax=unclassified Streptacidiphilus TaxID=2643834 RepID=UPI003511DD2F
MTEFLSAAALRAVSRTHLACRTVKAKLTASSDPVRRKPADGGYSTEMGVITALLVLIAIAVVTALGNKLMAKVNSINM